MAVSKGKILLFGGGGCHDYKSICPLLAQYLGEIAGISVDYVAEDYDIFRADRISAYDMAVIYHTGGELPPAPKRGLVEWVASGKGFVGVHSAADSFKNAPKYLAMLGGVFRAHPFKREYIVSLADNEHPISRDIEGYSVENWEKWPVYEYKVRDEQYLLDYDRRVRVLATALFKGVSRPVAWVKPWGKGKVFYLALGHDVEACRNTLFRKLFINGSQWALSTEPDVPVRDGEFDI